MHDLLDAALAVAPALASFAVVETWAGLRPGSHDGRPYLGRNRARRLRRRGGPLPQRHPAHAGHRARDRRAAWWTAEPMRSLPSPRRAAERSPPPPSRTASRDDHGQRRIARRRRRRDARRAARDARRAPRRHRRRAQRRRRPARAPRARRRCTTATGSRSSSRSPGADHANERRHRHAAHRQVRVSLAAVRRHRQVSVARDHAAGARGERRADRHGRDPPHAPRRRRAARRWSTTSTAST